MKKEQIKDMKKILSSQKIEDYSTSKSKSFCITTALSNIIDVLSEQTGATRSKILIILISEQLQNTSYEDLENLIKKSL
jgi:hypothetical protein